MKSPVTEDYTSLIALEAMVENSMKIIQGKRAMLCSDVAKLYHVSPEYLHKQVSKNMDCFPKTFMFKLSSKEQVIFKEEKYSYVFTEQGILMAGGKLKSEQAIKIHVQLIRYFVQLFNETVKNLTLMEKLKNITRSEKIFDILEAMSKEK